MPAATLPTTVPTTPAVQGLAYAICLGLMLPAAGLFPLWCVAALRGKGWGRPAFAALAGVVAITCAMVLQRPIPGVLPVVGLYFVIVTGAMLLFARLRVRLKRAVDERGAG